MKTRFPLSAKIALWFALNVLFLAILAVVFARVQFRVGLDSLLAGRANERLQSVAQLVLGELSERPVSEWSGELARFGAAYRVKLAVMRNDGTRLAGDVPELPAEVLEKMRAGVRGRPPPKREDFADGPPPDRGFEGPPPGAIGGPNAFPKFIVRVAKPPGYWIGTRLPPIEREQRPRGPLTLLMVSESLTASGLLIEFKPWLIAAGAAVLVSVLFWLPLVRGITRALGHMTGAAEKIAHGNFDTHVPTARRDELGRLGTALNDMAARLHEFFTGQKRFLGDIAHELCSPLARMEMALSILEQRADQTQLGYVADVREEVQQMSALVTELLSFSKAGMQARNTPLQPVPLAELARSVLAREAPDHRNVLIEIDTILTVLAEPELLTRALANVIRNAIRYAGESATIALAARTHGDQIAIIIADDGPGVPDESLHRLFDPFFRPEAARTRESGGVGLGLAIVKTCVEACGGSVAVRNRQPHGLEVEFLLQRAQPLALTA